MANVNIFLVSAGSPNSESVKISLASLGYLVAVSAIKAQAAIVVSERDGEGLHSVRELRGSEPLLPILFMTGKGSERLAVAAFEAGCSGYLNELWTQQDLLTILERLVPERPRENRALAGPVLIGNSRPVCDLRTYLLQISGTECNVLILGETGTGKELVAESIHANSPRRKFPFVCLNSAAIPDTLVESELFGHEKGAFTGAIAAQAGKLVYANQGTVFFDEIGDVSLAIQAKLLRGIESRRIYRLGSNRPIDLDVRLLAATNQDLDKCMAENRFRRDLYYRLSVVRVTLPALRERREDIPLLIGHFFQHFNCRWKRRLGGLSGRAMDTLIAHNWPGNIRELRNVVEAVFASLSPEVSGVVDIPPQVLQHLSRGARGSEIERDKILHALIATNWNRSKASEQLHWSRMTLYRKMQKHQLSVNSLKSTAY